MSSIGEWPRIVLIAMGLSYVGVLAVKRLRGQRNPDPRLARLETLQLIGFGGALVSAGLLWLSVRLQAPLPVIYVFIGGFLGGLVLWVGAYLVAWNA